MTCSKYGNKTTTSEARDGKPITAMEIGAPRSWGGSCGVSVVVLCNSRDTALASLRTPREI